MIHRADDLTNPDGTRHENSLSGPQEMALLALVSGKTVTRAAEDAGVTRQTVSLWLNQDAQFGQALIAERTALREEVLLSAGRDVSTILRHRVFEFSAPRSPSGVAVPAG